MDGGTSGPGTEARMEGASADPTILIHVGLHKTGTTWLQRRLFGPRADREITYCEDRDLMRGNFVVPQAGDFSRDRAREEFAPLLEDARQAGRPLVLQDEMLAGMPFHHRFMREVAADRLAETFPGAKLLVTVREQVSIIASSYGHYIRAGHSSSLRDFLAQPEGRAARRWTPIMNLGHFDYARLLETYERRFGQGNVVLVPMEWMLDRPAEFVARLSREVGVRLSDVAAEETRQVVNPASSDLAYAMMRHLNRVTPQDSRMHRLRESTLIKPSKVGWWVTRMTPASLRRRMKARTRTLIEAAVGDRYRESNRRVAERIGVDLGAYGYAV